MKNIYALDYGYLLGLYVDASSKNFGATGIVVGIGDIPTGITIILDYGIELEISDLKEWTLKIYKPTKLQEI